MRRSNIEKQVELSICEFFEYQGCMVVKIENRGFYNEKKAIFQTNNHPYCYRGIPDLHITLPDGKSLWVEVKRPSKDEHGNRITKGKVTPHQEWFIGQALERGGLACVAYSIDDVIEYLQANNYIITDETKSSKNA